MSSSELGKETGMVAVWGECLWIWGQRLTIQGFFHHLNRPDQLGQDRTKSHHSAALWWYLLCLVEALAFGEYVKY